MKVYDILTESNQVDEGPIRFLKRTLGKNTAGGKAAQLDVELDKEVDNIYKDYFAASKQDPKMGGMTAKGLANFLVAKGFISKPSAVMQYINQEPGMMRTAKKAGKSLKKSYDKGAAAVTGAASKLKKKLSPQPSGLTPDQPNLPGIESMYSEAQLMEVDVELSKGQVKKVIKRFVQQGFQSQVGDRISKSSYGDAPADAGNQQGGATATKNTGNQQAGAPKDTSKADAKKMATPTMDVSSAIKFLKSQGYTVTAPKKQKTKA